MRLPKFRTPLCDEPHPVLHVLNLLAGRDVPSMLASPEAERAMAETRAAIMYTLHSRRSTASGVMHQAMKSYFSGAETPSGDLDLEIERLAAVGVDDLVRAPSGQNTLGWCRVYGPDPTQ